MAPFVASLAAIEVAKDFRPVMGLSGGQTGFVAPVGNVSVALLGPSLAFDLLALGPKATLLFIV